MPVSGSSSYFMHDIVASNVRCAPDAVALIFNDATHTWRDFDLAVRRLRVGLTELGVTRGSRVAVLDRNSDRLVFLHYALASLGAILCPLNMWLRADELRYIVNNLQPGFLFTSDEFRARAGEAVEELDRAPRIVTHGAPRSGDGDWRLLAGADPEQAAALDMSAPESWEDPHMILYTSGTTGRPKGAVISHRRSVCDGLGAGVAFGIRRGERLYCYMPLFHTGAWDYLKLVFLSQGSAVLVDKFDADQAIRLIGEHRCNLMFGVPLVLRSMIASPTWATSDMSSMRLVCYGSYDPSNFLESVLAEFRARGAANVEALFPYGLTEGGPFVTIARPGDAERHPNSLGTPVPGVIVALLDDECEEAPAGQVGEICVRSPAVMSGYLNMPEATAEAFRGGWLHTGDLGVLDEHGFYHMVDRKKDMIRTGGENVCAKEVEQLIVSHPAIDECAVVGLPDPDYGEQVVAVAVRAPNADIDENGLKAFVRSRIAGFKTPKVVVFMDEIPKTPVGKFAKNALKKQLQAR